MATTTTNQAFINAIRKRAAEFAPNMTAASGLLILAKIAALCTLAEGRASDEDREVTMDLVSQDADQTKKKK